MPAKRKCSPGPGSFGALASPSPHPSWARPAPGLSVLEMAPHCSLLLAPNVLLGRPGALAASLRDLRPDRFSGLAGCAPPHGKRLCSLDAGCWVRLTGCSFPSTLPGLADLWKVSFEPQEPLNCKRLPSWEIIEKPHCRLLQESGAERRGSFGDGCAD